MKKTVVVFAIIMLCLSANLQAEDKDVSQPEKSKISTSISLKFDWVKPQSTEGYLKQRLTAYWHYKWLGAGIEMVAVPKNDYLETNPFLTANKGPLYLLAGLSTNSNGSDYIQAGIWYLETIAGYKVTIDARNYWDIAGEKSSYMENFLGVVYPTGTKISPGLELLHDHWWNSNDNCYFIGPVIYYSLTENTSIFLRLSREWYITQEDSSHTDRTRLGLKLAF